MNSGALEALNVIPSHGAQDGQISYRPLRDFVAYSTALASRPYGALGVVTENATVVVFAATQTALNMLSGGSTAWSDVSRDDGYDAGAEGRWSFTKFGPTVIATNGTDPIQAYSIGTSTAFAALSSDAPLARYCATVKNFVVFAYVSDSEGDHPQRLRWPAIEDPGTFPTIGSDTAVQLQSDQQDLLGEGGKIQGIVGGLAAADALVLMERKLHRMTYEGGRVIFSFDEIEGSRGCPAPGSIVAYGGRAYYLGEDGFYVTDGATSQPIGDGIVDRRFAELCDPAGYDRITSVIDPVTKIMMVAFPGPGNTDNIPNHVFIYSLTLGAWSHSDAFQIPMFAQVGTFGLTVDTVDAIYTGGVDAINIPVDSRLFAGGRAILSGFNASYELGYFTGSTLEATVDTTEANLTGDQFASLVNGCWPITDGGTVSAAIRYRDRTQDAPTFGSFQEVNDIGFAPGRARARYHGARLKIAAGGEWTAAQGVTFDAVKTGRRA